METRVFKEMVEVVKVEQQRREAELETMDSDYQHDRWLFTDLPLLSEMCLIILVALHHQIERELVKIAARLGSHEISGAEYQSNVQKEREALRKKDGQENLAERLKLKNHHGRKYIEVLRLLSNSYKHGPYMEPEKKLLKILRLDVHIEYAPLPESHALREAFARFVGLRKGVAFHAIAEQFVDKASVYVDAVQRTVTLCPIKWGRVSLHPKDFLH